MRPFYSYKIQINELFTFIILSCVFLFSLNLFNRYYYCIYMAFIVFLLCPGQRIKINYSTIFLFFLAMSILIFNADSKNSITNMVRPFTFLLIYTMGYSMIGKNEDTFLMEKKLQYIIYSVSWGSLCHYLLNMVRNIGSIHRDTVDIWTGTAMSATMQACLVCICIGILAANIFSNANKKKKILAVIFTAIILLYNLVLAGRTLIFLVIIIYSLAYFYECIFYKKRIYKNIWIILVVICIIYSLYNWNLFEVRTIIEESNFYERFFSAHGSKLLDDNRMSYKIAYLENLFDNPWGGNRIHKELGYYAHDLYLDTYDEAGVFAFIAVVMYIIASWNRLYRCIKSQDIPFKIKQLVFCVYIVVNLQFWIEPILQGASWLFAGYCLIDGSVSALLLNKKVQFKRLK